MPRKAGNVNPFTQMTALLWPEDVEWLRATGEATPALRRAVNRYRLLVDGAHATLRETLNAAEIDAAAAAVATLATGRVTEETVRVAAGLLSRVLRRRVVLTRAELMALFAMADGRD